MREKNILRMAEYIADIPQTLFTMSHYRTEYEDKHNQKCGSVGCIIGHCTILDKDENLPRLGNEIDFVFWSERFTGLSSYSDEWSYMFSGGWDKTDDTAIGASKRIKYFLEHGLPVTWKEEMHGEAPLSY